MQSEFLVAVFFSVRSKLQTEVTAARLEARNLHLSHQACTSSSDSFYTSVFSLNTTAVNAQTSTIQAKCQQENKMNIAQFK